MNIVVALLAALLITIGLISLLSSIVWKLLTLGPVIALLLVIVGVLMLYFFT